MNSFQKSIKDILTNINDDDLSTIKLKYNDIYGEDGYDKLLSEINNIENNYMINGSYDKAMLNDVSTKVTKYYETSINKSIDNKAIDLRKKESLLESFQSKMNDLVNSYEERVEYDDIQKKRKH